MATNDDIYTAGLMDGEGTITLTRMGRGEYRAPVVSVSSTTVELVQFLKTTYGGHIVTLKRKVKEHHKQAYHWVASRNAAIDMIDKIVPHMKEPSKVRRGLLILKKFSAVTSANGKYTDESRKLKEAFEVEFFESL